MTEGNGNGSQPTVGTVRVKQGLAQMLKGGVIVSAAPSSESRWSMMEHGGRLGR